MKTTTKSNLRSSSTLPVFLVALLGSSALACASTPRNTADRAEADRSCASVEGQAGAQTAQKETCRPESRRYDSSASGWPNSNAARMSEKRF